MLKKLIHVGYGLDNLAGMDMAHFHPVLKEHIKYHINYLGGQLIMDYGYYINAMLGIVLIRIIYF